MKEWIKLLFGGLPAEEGSYVPVDPTERFINELQASLAHERAVNAALLVRLGAPVEKPVELRKEIADADLEIINRTSKTGSQMKRRAMEILAKRRADEKTA